MDVTFQQNYELNGQKVGIKILNKKEWTKET